jgi:ADP-dependent NAD(P)H-hydrate dehydratase / NAD(P)H-hydrate epimerase
MLLLVGTMPMPDLKLVIGEVKRDGDYLVIDGQRMPRTQGTGAMMSAAITVTDYLKLPGPHALLAGDIGDGKGSREVYQYLADHVVELAPKVVTMHYLLPIMGLTKKVCQSVAKCARRPFMIADAGAMYAAVAAGLSKDFDLFTPDPSEMSYLADPNASHPAYIRRHLFGVDATQTPELVATAYQNNRAPKYLVVKGRIDYVAVDGKILETITEPCIPALEAIGGTGDTVTGLVTGFIYGGFDPGKAGIIAARTNRLAAQLVRPTPATKVKEIIDRFPEVFEQTAK